METWKIKKYYKTLQYGMRYHMFDNIKKEINNYDIQNTKIYKSIRSVNIILNVTSALYTIYNFLVLHDYSFGCIIGILTILLTILNYFICNYQVFKITINKHFKKNTSHEQVDIILKFSCLIYFILWCCFITYANIQDDMFFGGICLYGLPFIFSVWILFIKLIYKKIKPIFLNIYQFECSLTFIEMWIFFIKDKETIGGQILYTLAMIVWYLFTAGPISFFTRTLCESDKV